MKEPLDDLENAKRKAEAYAQAQREQYLHEARVQVLARRKLEGNRKARRKAAALNRRKG